MLDIRRTLSFLLNEAEIDEFMRPLDKELEVRYLQDIVDDNAKHNEQARDSASGMHNVRLYDLKTAKKMLYQSLKHISLADSNVERVEKFKEQISSAFSEYERIIEDETKKVAKQERLSDLFNKK